MLKLFLGLLLIPSSVASLLAAAKTMGGVAAHAGRTLPFLVGFFGYLFLRLFLFRPVRLYVLGHEISHAVVAWMSGAEVFGLHVGEKGGHVDISHSNAWIALAPYVLPIYAALTIFVYRFWMWCAPVNGHLRWQAHRGFLFAMGMTLSFHLFHTAEAISLQHQPDLDEAGGIVFSLAVIALLNGVVLILALKCLFPGVVSLEHSAWLSWNLTSRFWTTTAHYFYWLMHAVYGEVG